MTAETMTVHKALAELKILGGRIEGAILSGDFVITKKNNQDTVKGKTVEQYKAKTTEAFQKASDLIRRRNAIKNAVVVSNAKTMVKIGDKEYTVVEAIEKKNHGMDYYIQRELHGCQEYKADGHGIFQLRGGGDPLHVHGVFHPPLDGAVFRRQGGPVSVLSCHGSPGSGSLYGLCR